MKLERFLSASQMPQVVFASFKKKVFFFFGNFQIVKYGDPLCVSIT